MSEVNKVKEVREVKRKPRKPFLDVDVFATSFGPIAERGIYDVYKTTFKVEEHNMSKHSFSHCVNALRRLRRKKITE
jgi:hypothetical protein